MATQVGMSLTKVVILVGAGVTGSIMLRNGRLSDVLGEIQEMVKGLEKSAQKEGNENADLNEVLASQEWK